MAEGFTLRWRIAPRPRLRFRVGMSMAFALPEADQPSPVAVVIGPRGPAGSGSYDQTSPTDGIAVIGESLRIDIASLPLAD